MYIIKMILLPFISCLSSYSQYKDFYTCSQLNCTHNNKAVSINLHFDPILQYSIIRIPNEYVIIHTLWILITGNASHHYNGDRHHNNGNTLKRLETRKTKLYVNVYEIGKLSMKNYSSCGHSVIHIYVL